MGKKDSKKYNAKVYFSEIKRKEKNKDRLNNEINVLKDEIQDLKNKLKNKK